MRMRYLVFAAVITAFPALSAVAGVCDAPFMHDNGRTTLTGSGALQLGADLSFSEVKKSGPDQCQARVQGVATYGLMGLPPKQSELDYFMTVRNGTTGFERIDASGKREPVEGKFDLRMLGLFAYGEPIRAEGQTFPAQKFQITIDRKAGDAAPLVISTGRKTVGPRATIDTASGSQSCWPVRYSRVIDPTKASFNGIVLRVPGITSSVTDWFCPDVNMVMRQESKQGGVTSTVEVTELK